MWRVVLLLTGLLFTPLPSQERGGYGRLDGSGAFFFPPFAADPDHVLLETSAGPVETSTYLRYLAAHEDTRHLEELAFDFVLARECESRRLLRSAPVLARGLATRRLHDSGRRTDDGGDSELRRKFANEALRQLRIEAIVRANRKIDEVELRALFERRYGVGGIRAELRQVLVSFAATRRRLARAGRAADPAAVREAARTRATELHGRLGASVAFAQLLGESDDRGTRQQLKDPVRAAAAGLVSGYDQQRYGSSFTTAVQLLAIGEISPPVETTAGFHVVKLISRQATRFEDVADALRRQMSPGRVSPAEVSALRATLLEKYRVRVNR